MNTVARQLQRDHNLALTAQGADFSMSTGPAILKYGLPLQGALLLLKPLQRNDRPGNRGRTQSASRPFAKATPWQFRNTEELDHARYGKLQASSDLPSYLRSHYDLARWRMPIY